MQQETEIVHICRDEKFIDAAYEIYEDSFPGRNCFLILHSASDDEIKYLSEKNNYKFIYLTDDFKSKVNTFTTKAKVVVFHSLSPLNAKITLECDFGNAVKVCHIFGYEIYKNSFIKIEEIYGPLTKKITDKYKPSYKYRLKNELKYLVKNIIGRENIISKGSEADRIILSALKKIEMIGGLMPESFEMYQDKSLISQKTEYFKFSYYPIDKIISKKDDKVTSDNILLGNSAYPSNNHLEAFETLRDLELDNRKIIVPLSYGKDDYAQDIIDKGNNLFGENFHELTEFMPRDEYHNLMQSCGILIMNHYRQQAAGNIIAALYMGSKVYLSEKNILFQYFKRLGCYVFSIEDNLESDVQNGLQLLSSTETKINREILLAELSTNTIKFELHRALQPILIDN